MDYKSLLVTNDLAYSGQMRKKVLNRWNQDLNQGISLDPLRGMQNLDPFNGFYEGFNPGDKGYKTFCAVIVICAVSWRV
jgi:hypothetical protein